MNDHESVKLLEALAPLAMAIPIDDDGPVFAEPWQAQAFAIAVQLHERAAFDWPQWAQTLGDVILEDAEAGGCKSYYELWLIALERIAETSRLMSGEEYEAEKAAWEMAVAATPHGEPIELRRQVVAAKS